MSPICVLNKTKKKNSHFELSLEIENKYEKT